MRRTLRRTLLATFLFFVMFATSETFADTRFYVRIGPPAPVVERPYRGYRPDYVWARGHYRWDRRQYVWVPGYWARPPYRYAGWEPARWVHTPRGWYLVDGRWK